MEENTISLVMALRVFALPTASFAQTWFFFSFVKFIFLHNCEIEFHCYLEEPVQYEGTMASRWRAFVGPTLPSTGLYIT